MTQHRVSRFARSLAAASCALPALLLAVLPLDSIASAPEVTIKYLPGKYYEQEAQEAVKQKNFRRALQMYEKAGYWGKKIARIASRIAETSSPAAVRAKPAFTASPPRSARFRTIAATPA